MVFWKYFRENLRIHFLSLAKWETTGQRNLFARRKKILCKRLHHQEHQKHLQSLFKKTNIRLSKHASTRHLHDQLGKKKLLHWNLHWTECFIWGCKKPFYLFHQLKSSYAFNKCITLLNSRENPKPYKCELSYNAAVQNARSAPVSHLKYILYATILVFIMFKFQHR